MYFSWVEEAEWDLQSLLNSVEEKIKKNIIKT